MMSPPHETTQSPREDIGREIQDRVLNPPVGASGQVRLRPLELTDAAALADLEQDVDIHRYLGSSPSEAASRRMIEREMTEYQKREWGLLAIIAPAFTSIIGITGFISCGAEGAEGKPELIIEVAKPHRKQGIGIAACRAAIEWGFYQRRFASIYASVSDLNDPAKKLVQRLGMTRLGPRTTRDNESLYALENGVSRPMT